MRTLCPLVALLLALAVLSGCAGDPWARYESSVFTTIHEPGQRTWNAHLELLQEIVTLSDERGTKPPPGVCAECALYLVRLGRAPEAEAYLAREQRYYPESATFVAVLRRYASGAEQVLEGAQDEVKPEEPAGDAS